MRFFPPAGGDRELDARDFDPARQDVAIAATLFPWVVRKTVVRILLERNNLNREVL